MDSLEELHCEKDQEEEESVSISNQNSADTVESFEMVSVSGVPLSGSEELNRMTNSSFCVDSVVGYMQQLSGGCIEKLCEAPVAINLPNIGVFRYFGSFLPGQLSSSYDDENGIEEEVNNILKDVSSPESGRRHRDCLVKAIEGNFREVIDENLAGDVEINLLERRGCINKEDSRYLNGKSVEPRQCMRALVLMMLNRDIKSLLTFVYILKFRNISLFERIIQTFHHHMHTGYSGKPQCLCCLLIDRVNIRLVADYLDISAWRKFLQKVSEAKLSESGELWKEFFKDVRSRSLYTQVMSSLQRAIEDCGFHSDILLIIQNDIESQRDSFDCRCCDIDKDCVESNITQGPSVPMKRKISQMEDAKVTERPTKKTAEQTTEKPKTSTGNAITETLCEIRQSAFDTETCYQNVEKNQRCHNAKKDSMDNLKMEKLKVGVPGYDSEHDSGLPPDPSLRSFGTVSDSDSGVFGQSRENQDETIPKQFVRDPILSVSQDGKTKQNHDEQKLEDSGRQLECIDAEHSEGSELHVNKEALIDALDEPSENEDVDTNIDSSFDIEKRQNSPIQPNSIDEPFINIVIKTDK